MSISRDNHYLPQMYLKQWAQDGRIQEYRLIVSHASVPNWKRRTIKSAAVQKNLYLRMEDDIELDDIEHWFDQNFEEPAAKALNKVCTGIELSNKETHLLLNFVIAQWVRTPAFHQVAMRQGQTIAPSVLENIAKEAEDLSPQDIVGHLPKSPLDSTLIPISIKNTGVKSDSSHTLLEISTIVGKGFWLAVMKYYLNPDSAVYQYLHKLKWSIVSAPAGCFWPTSDNPFVVTRVSKSGSLSLVNPELGIGHKKTVLLFPISPQKVLLGTRFRKYKRRFEADNAMAQNIKRCFVENAFLYIYCRDEDSQICQMRPRIIDTKQYQKTKESYDNWYDNYKDIEAPLLSSTHTIGNL